MTDPITAEDVIEAARDWLRARDAQSKEEHAYVADFRDVLEMYDDEQKKKASDR